jgi:hypothetical protein
MEIISCGYIRVEWVHYTLYVLAAATLQLRGSANDRDMQWSYRS